VSVPAGGGVHVRGAVVEDDVDLTDGLTVAGDFVVSEDQRLGKAVAVTVDLGDAEHAQLGKVVSSSNFMFFSSDCHPAPALEAYPSYPELEEDPR
jgi:hypothetical protein